MMDTALLPSDIQSTDRPYLVVALTGSIGSGKSVVAERLARCGAHIIDADILARKVVEAGSEALNEIEAHFGSGVIDPSGQLDRKRLGEIVFRNPAEREWLEGCLHPRVRTMFLGELARFVGEATFPPSGSARESGRAIIVYVVPLLFESPTPRTEFDYTVVVAAPREVALRRIITRDGCSAELAERKLAAQLPIERKVALADFTIENRGSLDELDRAVVALYKTLTSLSPRPGGKPSAST